MATEAPVEIIIGSFRDEAGAKQALHELNQAKKEGFIEIRDAALLTRDEHQKLHISESADKGFGRGAVIGGVAGAAVGLVAGPIGWAALGGAAIGGLATKLRDGGVPDERLRQMGETIQPGEAALVAVIELDWVENVEELLERQGAAIVKEEVAPQVAAQLDEEAAKVQEEEHAKIGPVEFMAVGFPGNQFRGEIVPALGELVKSNTIRILDFAFVTKDADGNVLAMELEDVASATGVAFKELESEFGDLVNEDDLQAVADALLPNSSAAVLVWEDVWAAKLVTAISDANGMLLDLERIPREVVLAALAHATKTN